MEGFWIAALIFLGVALLSFLLKRNYDSAPYQPSNNSLVDRISAEQFSANWWDREIQRTISKLSIEKNIYNIEELEKLVLADYHVAQDEYTALTGDLPPFIPTIIPRFSMIDDMRKVSIHGFYHDTQNVKNLIKNIKQERGLPT